MNLLHNYSQLLHELMNKLLKQSIFKLSLKGFPFYS